MRLAVNQINNSMFYHEACLPAKIISGNITGILGFCVAKQIVARYLIHDVLELHNGDANEPVVSTEAVVLHPDVKFIGRHLVLVSDDAKRAKTWCYPFDKNLMLQSLFKLKNLKILESRVGGYFFSYYRKYERFPLVRRNVQKLSLPLRVGRVQSSELGLHHPQASVPTHPLWGHTRLRERGWGVPLPTRGRTVWYVVHCGTLYVVHIYVCTLWSAIKEKLISRIGPRTQSRLNF